MGIVGSARKNKALVTTVAFVGASCLGLLSCLAFPNASVFADAEADTEVYLNLAGGIAIRILNSAASSEITSLDLSTNASPSGTFVPGDFKVQVSTSNTTGYKLYMDSSYMIPDTSNYSTGLINQFNTNYTIPSVAAAVSKTDLSTAAPGTTNANKWAYSLDDTTYNPIPVHGTPDQIDSYNQSTTSRIMPIYVGMNVNTGSPSGTYKNQLTFSAIANPVPTEYTLYFQPGGTGVSGLPETMTASVVAASYDFTIPSTAPTRTGYIFTGYSDGTTTYQPGGTITVLGDEQYVGSATLTAQWRPVDFWDISTMQEMTSSICSALYTPSNATGNNVTIITDRATYESTVTADNQPYVAQSTLRDVRDNNTYVVRKLADGNCWMTSNLKYSLSANSTRIGVNHSTNETFEFNTGADCGNNGACVINSNTIMTEHYDGYYYSWYAATAGTGTPDTVGEAAGSICPKGWRLPANYTISSTRSYGALTQAYLGFHEETTGDYTTELEAIPLQFRRAGFYSSGALNSGGQNGVYWSNTAGTADGGYYFIYNTYATNPQTPYTKYGGFPVRCVNN